MPVVSITASGITLRLPTVPVLAQTTDPVVVQPATIALQLPLGT